MDAMFTPLAYGMTGRQVRNALNNNSIALEIDCLGESITDLIFVGLNYSNFISAVNSKFTRPANAMAIDGAEYDLLATDTSDIVSIINDNYDAILNQKAAFLTNGIAYWIDVRQDIIPSKGIANILSQQGLFKLGYYTGEDILYISVDCGLTWPYSKVFSDGCDNIRMAQIFKDGNILIATLQNKIYSSDDLLTTLTEETMMESDGVTPMSFHEPQNASYPGAYFAAACHSETFIIDDKEMFLWGNYPHHNAYGAAPIQLYCKINNGTPPRVIYKLGQNTWGRDDGTSKNALNRTSEEGNLLGDSGNSIQCDHIHALVFNQFDNTFWVQTGDFTGYTNFIKLVYNSETNNFIATGYVMNPTSNNQYQIDEIRFFDGGNQAMFCSDGDGKIYSVDYANLTSANIANYTVKYTTAPLAALAAISHYSEVMFVLVYNALPDMIVSINYGSTWERVDANYMKIQFTDDPKYLMRIRGIDSNGFTLIHRQSNIAALNATESLLVKIHKK